MSRIKLAIIQAGITQADIRILVFVGIHEIRLALNVIPFSPMNKEGINGILYVFRH